MNDDARFERLRDRLGELHGLSHALARQIGDVDISDLRGPADLALIPVLRKSALAELQRPEPPFGGLASAPTSAFARLFASPGGLYEPEPAGPDPWGAAKALRRRRDRAGRGRRQLLLLPPDPRRPDPRKRRDCAWLPGHSGRAG